MSANKQPRNTGAGGRPKGSPNRATANAREAIGRLVDRNTARMEQWLDQIAEEQGPLMAWKCLTDVIEYHVPKLARTELTGPDGGALNVRVQQFSPPRD